MTVRTLVVLVVLGAAGVFGARYAHERFLDSGAAYSAAATRTCVEGVRGFRSGPTETKPGGERFVLATPSATAALAFFDSTHNAALAKADAEDTLTTQGRDPAGLLDLQGNALVTWTPRPSGGDRSAVLGCLG
jgi:hypothetical protein